LLSPMSPFVEPRFPRIGNTFVEDVSPTRTLLKSNSFSHLPASCGWMDRRKRPVTDDVVRELKVKDPRERYFGPASTCASSGWDLEPQSPSVHSCPWSSTSDLNDDSSDLGSAVEQIVALPEHDLTKTTVVAKNFPVSYTKSMVLELLDAFGFIGKYDFVYVPVEFGTMKSFGYASINFVAHSDALRFGQLFNGFSFWAVWSDNVGNAVWGRPMQGQEKHVERYRDSPMMHKSLPDDVKPAIFKDGELIAFPPPTKALKMPRRAARKLPSSSGAAVASAR